VSDPTAARPYMPGYGIAPASGRGGLLPWSWAEERLLRSRDFWLSTVTAEGLPHLMPVWAVWHEGRLWFSSSNGSRKARNLIAAPWCCLVTEPSALETMLAAENAKYGTSYGIQMVDPASNSVFAVRPERIFALDASDFTGSPTRFTFGRGPG
jgi:nitroimidazol reductase NimA-like FMN-containing flavoprotein (pyridoxamine 5'-phosphate oxidase superfamily)